jgi:uncharacterized protein YcbK (DUF882 family)
MKQNKLIYGTFALLGLVYLVRLYIKRLSIKTEMEEGTNEAITNDPNLDAPFPKGSIPQSKYFELSEFHSNDGVKVTEQYYGNLQKLMKNLDVLRDYLDTPLFINSGYRSPSHNKKVGGVSNSMHLYAKAADMRALNKTPKEIKLAIETLIAKGKMSKGGLGIYPTFIHYDTRGTNARWAK